MGKGSEQRLPQEPRLNKVNTAFCLQITESNTTASKINGPTKVSQSSSDAVLTYSQVKVLLIVT